MPNVIRTIVAGVSQPAEDDPTLLAAAELARWTGAALHLVLAYNLPAAISPMGMPYATPEWTLQHGDNLRDHLQAAARRVPGGDRAVCHAVAGAPAHSILETAERVHADLVVVGAARPGRLGGPFLGTTAQRVLRGAAAPVLVVRTPLQMPLGRVLLTTDLSELSAAVHERGLDAVTSLFGEPGAVRSLLVLPYLIVPVPLPRASIEQTARTEVEGFLATRRPRGTPVEAAVREGAPGDEIAAEARSWGADLLVVGTHGRGWGERLLLGSVAEAALRDAPCSVLAIPPRALVDADGAAEHAGASTSAGATAQA